MGYKSIKNEPLTMINLKNYTSTIPADQSILNIERLLVQAGASHIMKEYQPFDGIVDAISFKLKVGTESLSYRLPANVEAIVKLFIKNKRSSNPTEAQKKTLKAQAIRTAWKNIHEWVHLQLTMVELQQVEVTQIFLPYMLISPTQTVFDKFKESNFKALSQ